MSGFIKKSDGSGCDACAANCTVCTTAGKCETTCNAGFLKKADGSGCDSCAENCNVCTTKDQCNTSCKDGFGLSGQ